MGEFRPKWEQVPGDDSDGLRREYKAGRISADSYIAAGGDPDVVRDTEAARARGAAVKKAADDKSATRWALGCIAIPVLLVGGCLALGSLGADGGDSGRAETAAENKWGAERICKQSVEKQLKDPDSAKYSELTTVVTDSSPPVFGYVVTGTVRATNSFGGVAAHTFSCDATYDSDTGVAEGTARLS